MAKTLAMAARWEHGGQVSMGTAGRDRRVRASPKVKAKAKSNFQRGRSRRMQKRIWRSSRQRTRASGRTQIRVLES